MKNVVRELRDSRGLSQADLAEALGVSRQTINSIENDRYAVAPIGPGDRTILRPEEVFDDD